MNENYVERIFDLIDKIGLFNYIANAIICFSVIAIYVMVFKNFKRANEVKNKRVKEVKSIVETFSMSLFFLICYLLLVFNIGHINSVDYVNYSVLSVVKVVALIVVAIGACFNIIGRVNLGDNWGNNVIIYSNHNLIRNGVYKIVRHPLYASIIWIIYSCSIVYENIFVFILNTIIFIPFMYYRAKQEEKELVKIFKDYVQYQKEVGMFFPNLLKMMKAGKNK